MNTVPTFIRVMPEALGLFVWTAFLQTGFEEDLARLMADTLMTG